MAVWGPTRRWRPTRPPGCAPSSLLAWWPPGQRCCPRGGCLPPTAGAIASTRQQIGQLFWTIGSVSDADYQHLF
eukprot:1183287-Prorocentrum_minimum.AAC.3